MRFVSPASAANKPHGSKILIAADVEIVGNPSIIEPEAFEASPPLNQSVVWSAGKVEYRSAHDPPGQGEPPLGEEFGDAQELVPVERALLDHGLDGEDTSRAYARTRNSAASMTSRSPDSSRKHFSRLRAFGRSDPSRGQERLVHRMIFSSQLVGLPETGAESRKLRPAPNSHIPGFLPTGSIP